MTQSLNVLAQIGTPLHAKILELVLSRYRYSRQMFSSRHTLWQAQDKQAMAYITDTDANALRKDKKKNEGITDYVTVEIPYSYGMLLTAHTYITSVFLSRDPVYQFSARHGEGQQNVMAVEALMDYQFQVGQHAVPHYIWVFDALKYGLGVVGLSWKKEIIQCSSIQERPKTFMGMPLGGTEKVRVTKQITGYEGTELYNVRPYKFFPDPRIPVWRFQEGEFCGMEFELSYSDLLAGAAQGEYFNVDAAKKSRGSGQAWASDQFNIQQQQFPDAGGIIPEAISGEVGFMRGVEMHVRIIPADWGLGTSQLPEKWVFTVVNDTVVIGARPLGEYHDKFPFAVLQQEIDGYALTTRGVMEQVQSMNDVLTWLFNSHFYNVRAALNNQFIYDPSMISSADLLDPGPGKRIRLKPDAYGKDVRSVISQLPVGDVTSAHFNDFNQVTRLLEQTVGINANLMGIVNPGGRKTATEVRASSSAATNRLKTISEYMSAMGYSRLAQMALQSTQQHYSGERVFKIIGNISDSNPFMNITPDMIAGFYDFVPVDGTEPIDRFAQANLWNQLMQQMGALGLGQAYDIPGIFTWVAQLAGMRNIKQFRVKMGDPGQLAQQAGQGNLVPVGQPSQPQPTEPGQITGMGQTT